MLGQDWSSVFLQRFDGSVTIWPRTRIRDWFRLLTDPDVAELKRMLRVGELGQSHVNSSYCRTTALTGDSALPFLPCSDFPETAHDLEPRSYRTRGVSHFASSVSSTTC